MKIVTVNCTYQMYSTGKIIKDIENVLHPLGCQFVHCYEVGESSIKGKAYRLSGYLEYRIYYVLAHILGLQYAGGLFSNVRLRKILKKEMPDIVHIHCPNAYSINIYKLLRYLKKNKIPTVITNHAEFFFTGNCAHAGECIQYMDGCKVCSRYKEAGNSLFFNRTTTAWEKMRDAFAGFDNIQMVAVSPWAEERMNKSTICGELPSHTIYNGIDTETIFYPRENVGRKQKASVEKEKVLLHVTSRFVDKEDDWKGGYYIIELAKRLKKLSTNYKIIVVGPYELQQDYSDLDNLAFWGKINNQDRLAELYSMADLLIVTSKRETFGLTCIESMCCGTPVVGFKNGGTESVALPEYSEFTEFGDVEKLQYLVIKWIECKSVVTKQLSEIARQVYSKEQMALNYYKVYKELAGKE